MIMRGIEFAYVPTDPRGGVLTMQSDVPMNDGFLAVWEGVFLFVHEACRVAKSGVVRPASLEPGGLRASVGVSW
jgi:hypothetical protein